MDHKSFVVVKDAESQVKKRLETHTGKIFAWYVNGILVLRAVYGRYFEISADELLYPYTEVLRRV